MERNQTESALTIRFASNVSEIENIQAAFNEFFIRFGKGQFENVKTIIRELALNAVEHGNGDEPSLPVNITAEHLDENRFRIEVKDSGRGFDFKDLDFLQPDGEGSVSSRGLKSVHSIADELIFEDNGATVVAYLTLESSPEVIVTNEEDMVKIKPAGNLSAANADYFERILINRMNEGAVNFVFDFEVVEQLDSICLSILLNFSKQYKRKYPDGQLSIVNVKPSLNKVFDLTRMSRVYNIYSSFPELN